MSMNEIKLPVQRRVSSIDRELETGYFGNYQIKCMLPGADEVLPGLNKPPVKIRYNRRSTYYTTGSMNLHFNETKLNYLDRRGKDSCHKSNKIILPPVNLKKGVVPFTDYSMSHIFDKPTKRKNELSSTRVYDLSLFMFQDVSIDVIERYLFDHPDFVEKFILTNIPSEQIIQWQLLKAKSMTEILKDEPPSDYGSMMEVVDIDSSEEVIRHAQKMENEAQNFSIVNKRVDVYRELQANLEMALSADGSYLYIAEETQNYLYLYTHELRSTLETSSIVRKIAPGSTVAAYVAWSKHPERIGDIFAVVGCDDRYPEGIPSDNPRIQSVLAQPITMKNGKVLGVVELFRNVGRQPFLKHDEEISMKIVHWASMSVFYAECYYKNIQQQILNEYVLDVTQSMFKKFKDMDSLMIDIMKYSKNLVKADRATLFITDLESDELCSHIFDNGTEGFKVSEFIRFPMTQGIAGFVARTGKSLIVHDAYSDLRFQRDIDQITGYTTQSIMCLPVRADDEIIGVLQLLNKIDGQFTQEDEEHFYAMSIYCGLALHIAKMYEQIRRSEQKYRVALEVLSYHSQYTLNELSQLRAVKIPKFIHGIADFKFSPWGVDEFHKPLYYLYMFGDLFGLQSSNFSAEENSVKSYSGSGSFRPSVTSLVDRIGGTHIRNIRFEQDTLMKFTLTVRKNYRKVPYHNWAHAFSVAHAMYTVLKSTSQKFTLEEQMSMLVAALCHDIDHRGKTNAFINKSDSPIACLYSTSVMEHHHFNITVMLLQREGHNIFQHLSSAAYKDILGKMKHCILATDLAKFFEYKSRLESILLREKKVFDWNSEDHRSVLMAISMTTCDLCSMYKPWKIQLGLVMVIMEEFWIQGDEEKEKGLPTLRMMDRDYKYELPESQVGFIKGICLPCYTLLYKVLPEVKPMVKGSKSNLKSWEQMSLLTKEQKIKRLQALEQMLREESKSGKNMLNMT